MALKSFEKYSMLFGQDKQYESSSVSTHSLIDLILHCLEVKSIHQLGFKSQSIISVNNSLKGVQCAYINYFSISFTQPLFTILDFESVVTSINVLHQMKRDDTISLQHCNYFSISLTQPLFTIPLNKISLI